MARGYECLFKLRLASHELLLGFRPLALAFIGDPQRIVDRGDKRVVGLLDGRDVDHTTLDLRATKVTGAGLKELAALKSLTTLHLGSTEVTDAGVEELAALESLTTLNLNSTRVTDAGVKHLTALTGLTTLYLRGTKVTDAGVSEAQKALPKCKILLDER